jgi:7-alpha-hydroxysteroid dehydrogenase
MGEVTARSGRLAGLGVIVTGGGTGIGRACAARLAADGAAVTICGRTESALVDAVQRITAVAGNGGSAQYVVADVTDEQAVQRVVARALESSGRLYGCVANAGGAEAPTPLHLQDLAAFVRVLHANLVGSFLCLKHVVPHLVSGGSGSFVGISSIASHVTHRYFGAYSPAKAGIDQLMRNAADEYGPAGVRFNAVCPGFIATEIMEYVDRNGPIFASYVANIPLGHVGEPEDVAELVRFLMGPESRFITGQVIGVDGGHGLRRGPDFSSFVEAALGGPDAVLGKAPPA